MNLHLLTTPWQRALGAMFQAGCPPIRAGLGDSGLVFLYPYSAPRLFQTCFCPPLYRRLGLAPAQLNLQIACGTEPRS